MTILDDILDTETIRRNNNAEQARNWREKNSEKWKEITKKSQSKYYKNNKEKCRQASNKWLNKNENYFRKRDLKRQYGLTLDDIEKMKNSQNNKCKICLEEKELVVDHCHKTNQVRGLLCRNCNYALGHFKDSINIISNALEYLKC